MGARTNWLTRDKTDDDIKFSTKSEFYDRVRTSSDRYAEKTSYSAQTGEVDLSDLFGDAPKNATIESFNDKPYEKNDSLMSDMDTAMNSGLLERLFSTITNDDLNYTFMVAFGNMVVGVAVYKDDVEQGHPVKKMVSQVTDADQVASYIKEEFEQGTKSVIRQKYDLQNYKEADQYLSGLLAGNKKFYDALQSHLPTNMSVTDWLKTVYGVAVYDDTTNTIVRRKENDSGLAERGVASVTNYNEGTTVRSDTSSIWDALLQDTRDENGKTVSLIRKVARNKKEAEELIDDTAGSDQTAKDDLEKKVKGKKNSKGENYKDVDEWLDDQYQGGDAQQDGKTWDGENSDKGSDNYMWIWLLGIGLCLAAEYAVWKKRKEK